MMDVLGWLAVIGIVSYLGHYLYLMIQTDREIDDNIIEPFRQDHDFKAGQSGQVQPASGQAEGTGSADREAGEE